MTELRICKMKYTIYELRHKITGQCFYIGQTNRNLSRRLTEHRSVTRRNLVSSIMNTYGKDNIEIIAIDHANSLEESLMKEDFWIRFFGYMYNTVNCIHGAFISSNTHENLVEKFDNVVSIIEKSRNYENHFLYLLYYNFFDRSTFWGKTYKSWKNPMSTDKRIQISRTLKERYKKEAHHMFGKHLSQETKDKLSIANKNRSVSIETRKKNSEALTGIKRRPYSEEEKEYKRISSPNKHACICITTGEKFMSIAEAFRKTGINKGHISSCCTRNRKTAGKSENGTPLEWRYLDDVS